MFGVVVITPPAAVPVTAAELRARLRLNTAAEDALLGELLAGAVELFERDTGRPVLATAYRQHLSRWPFAPAQFDPLRPPGAMPEASGWALGPWVPGQIVLARGGVTAVTGVFRALADGSPEAVTGWAADLHTPPARVRLAAQPPPAVTAAGLPVSPVGHVEYTAGWADAAAVPQLVRTALMLLAAHWYEHREAHTADTLKELPNGWRRVCDQYRTGLTGDWGQ